MDLGSLWQWNPRKLPCSVRQDAGNPTVDDLREKLAEIAGVNLRDIIDDFKKTKMSSSADTQNDFETNKKYKEILSRSHVVGAVQQALESVEPKRDTEKSSTSISLRNIKKTYYLLPKSPPKRVLMELNREIAKPLVLPNQDDSKAVTARLEKKLAKQRAVRRNNTEEVVLKTLIDQDIQSPVVDAANILKKWSGDLFSSCDVLIPGGYLGGMIYLSRMADSENKSNKKYEINNDVTSFDSTKTTEEKDEKVGKNIIGDEKNSTLPISSSGVDTEAKLYCAKALCNWARNPANAKRLAEEGAVNAIITLAKEPNLRISFFCAGAFRFMSESLIIATLMIDEGNAISTISDMIKNGQSDDVIVGNLTIALVNLTRVNGKEGQTVEAMLHQALMFVLQGFPDLSSTCARGLYNLTCVDATYPLIEKVIRALIQLSSSTNTANVKHVCAAALCNLADLKSVRLRLVEEGVISIIGLLVKNAETRTRRVCAVILQNLSAAKSCRVEMVSRSAVQAAHLLSSDSDPIILRCIGLTLSRLAIDHNNSTRIIHELGIAALCNIAVKFPTVAGISQPVSTAFQLLSSNAGVRLTIVQEGSVAAIASLMKNSQDIYTLQHCLLALCNLLYEHDNHLSIVQQGLIVTMITLSSHENDTLRDLTSLAFLNLSYADDSRKHAVNAGGVVAIIGLTRGKSNVTKRRCAAALCNLSSQSTVMDRMVADGVIPCLVKLVTSNDLETVRYACAALCRLCATKENGQLIMFSGAVPNLVQGAIKGDAGTQQYCGAVLSSLSSYESCRVQLFDTGIISALRTLAALNDDVTKQRCLSAFANLSCEESIQLKMVEQGVVSIISDLADSYQEITFMYCAQALCNLACNDEARLQVASEGGVRAMMMISMVRSVDMRTKQLCITALSNLLDDSTIQYLLGEGIVGSIANLSKMDNPKTLHLCAILFNQLTFYPEACLKIAERYVPLSTIFSMVHAANVETRIVAARTTCNLLFSKEVRDKAIEAGALGALQAGIESGNEDAASHCLRALFSSSKDLKILIFIAQTTIPLAVCSFAIKYSDEKHDIALKILSLLSWHIESRKYIQNKAFATILIKLAITNLQRSSYQNLALVFRYFCLGFQDHRELLEAGIMSAVEAIYDMNDPSDFEVSSALADVIRSLAEIPECVVKLSTHKIMTILKSILDICYSDVKTMYNVCVIIYCLASHGSESRLATASSITVTALLILSSYPECKEAVTSSICAYLSDPCSRKVFANRDIATIIVDVLESVKDVEVLYNGITCIYLLSRRGDCVDFLVDSPLHTDMILLKLSKSEDSMIRANCSRALKNMTSDSSEALEIGAVASLIAMSLEGKDPTIAKEDSFPPHLSPSSLIDPNPPSCFNEKTPESLWFATKTVIPGGAAGTGPEAPDPPSMNMSETADYPLLHEEAEAMDIESGKTKMAFAKMQSTQALRDLCMLTDADFESARDDDEVSSTKIDNMNDGGQLGFTNNSESGLETVFESANSRASTTASPIRLNDSDSLNITTQSFETTELNNSADDSLILPNGTITDNNGDDTIQAMPKNSNPNTTSNKGSKSSGGGGGGVKKQNSSNLSKPMKVSSDVVSSKQSLHQTNPTIGDEALPATTQQQVDTTPTDGTRKQSKVTPSNKELTASLSLYSSPKNP